MPFRSFLLHLCSATLVTLASRVPWLGPLVFVALVPSLWSLRSADTPRQWLCGGIACFFFLCVMVYYWIYYVTYTFGGLPLPLSLLTVILFALISLWQGALGYWAFGWLRHKWELVSVAGSTLLFATVFTLAWHTVPALFLWDWALLLRYQTYLIQCIDRIGTVGLDWCILFVNYNICTAVQQRRVQLAIPSLLLIGGIFGYGLYRVPQITAQLQNGGAIRVALVQPNIDSGAKALPSTVQQSLRTLETLSDTAARQHPALIIWPESVFPIDLEQSPRLLEHLRAATLRWRAPLLLGSMHFAEQRGREQRYNSAILVAPSDTPLQIYRKHVLLAFGEYIPFEAEFPQMRAWLPDRIGEFARGDGPRAFQLGFTAFAPVICYESIDRTYIADVARLPVQFIAEITNDGWYGTTTAVTVHKDLAALRAIENRISIVRTTNTGITTVIDPLGRELGTLPQETAQVSLVDVPLRVLSGE